MHMYTYIDIDVAEAVARRVAVDACKSLRSVASLSIIGGVHSELFNQPARVP